MGKTLMLFFLLLTFESTSQSSDKIYDKTNKPALFPGCERRKDCANDLLEKYIAYQIRNVHPTGGKVNVSFVVEPDGSLTNIEAQTEKGSKQAIESERIIQSMNKNGIKWLPGLIKDNSVRSKVTVPIKFTNPLPEILRDLEIVKIGSTDSIHIFPEVKAKLDTCKEITIDYLNYFCSSEAALTMLYKNIHYPVKGTNARVVIGIVVTKSGKTAAFTKLETPPQQEFVDETLKTMNKIFITANWIPGQVNGKPVNSMIIVPTEFVTR